MNIKQIIEFYLCILYRESCKAQKESFSQLMVTSLILQVPIYSILFSLFIISELIIERQIYLSNTTIITVSLISFFLVFFWLRISDNMKNLYNRYSNQLDFIFKRHELLIVLTGISPLLIFISLIILQQIIL